MKPFLNVCLSLGTLVALSAPAASAASAKYRIDLRDGRQVLARDLPVRRGTIITFHEYLGGVLTGLPQEVILRIEPDSARTSVREASPRPGPKLQGGVTNGLQQGDIIVVGPAEGLKPGEILVLGPTGEGGASLPQSGASGVPGAAGTGQTAIAPNGVPANGALTTLSPDGTPVLSPGVPGSSTPAPVGSNGTPVLAQPGVPGTAAPNIGSNGAPVLARPGTPGATPPTIGPNGTPVLAQPGTPGATPPTIGPNGTPVVAPPGAPGTAAPNTAPNGTPNAAPPSGSGSPPSGNR